MVSPNISNFTDFIRLWNNAFVSTDSVISTFTETVKAIPKMLLEVVACTHIWHFAFYRCKFRHISFNVIPHMKSIQHLEFPQSPFETIHPEACDLIPSVKKISLTSTKLPGIPEAIFCLKTLACVNMSYRNVPPGVEFNFWPGSRNRKSSAYKLITSGSMVTLLRDRGLCGFPNLNELHMDGCDLKILLGCPFICLKKLKVLSLQANKITELNEATLAGLTSLLMLNLNRNRLTVSKGMYLFRWCPCDCVTYPSTAHNCVDKPVNSSAEVLFAQHNGLKKWTRAIFSRMRELKCWI
ncbi:hypothetical protein HPB48_019514 [Haemaphysalis longicornis]|uniref:Uncharacterized protein n=1 Tax=Haemaphysalis longicornis TaxID=44386 RepID=A0A9J6G9L8_HAELO|nr:hypothetical protein HPB48_019514 [Haemaphysalis longicornis]